jgi:hypothetical protein
MNRHISRTVLLVLSSRGLTRLLSCLALAALLAGPGLSRPAAPVAGASHGGPRGGQGIQGGWAVDDSGNATFYHSLTSQYGYMHDAGAGWVRINFRLGACFQDWTSTRGNCRRDKTALQVYTEVVQQAQSGGLKVMGLLSNESWKGSQTQWTAGNAETRGGTGDNRYVKDFAEKGAGVLAKHFNGQSGRPLIAEWQVWNEPNAWTYRDATGNPAGGTFIYPSNFAWLLKRSHVTIKASGATPAQTVIAGGIFGHDIGGATMTVVEDGTRRRVTKFGTLAGTSLARPVVVPQPAGKPPAPETAQTCTSSMPSGADYLCQTYDMGIRKAGWQAGAYPLDHVGQHLYVNPGAETTSAKLDSYLQELRNAYAAFEGTDTGKRTHLTEFGWETRPGYATTYVQAKNLETAYTTFRNTTYVGRAYWFSVQDIPEGDIYYGLVDGDGEQKCGTQAGQTKCALTSYQSHATYSK